ncbi:MAG: 3-hydroxyacyl-ACP dehydratase FabZ [Oligoflexia bacterium]|nr:3-hydroxyacyl-ACP dehydratase FabZ [Oligoflexia bacterium]
MQDQKKEEQTESSGVVFGIAQIQKILPHRYPFLLIDRVVELVDNERVVAIKNVTANEPFFNGHFPGNPVMPGVLIVEAIAQTGAILAKTSKDGVGKNMQVLLVGANDVKFKKRIVPGDTLRIVVKSARKRRPLWIMDGEVFVDGKLVATGSISAMEVASEE